MGKFIKFPVQIFPMIPWSLQAFFVLVVLMVGSYTDLKKREVPDWVSHGLIYLGFGVNLILALIFKHIMFLVMSIAGFLLCFGLGYAMYQLGQWGGGDAKIIMGVGAMMGVWWSPDQLVLVTFLINSLLVGAVYGIAWSIGVAIKHRKVFVTAYKKFLRGKTIIRVRLLLYVVIIAGLLIGYLGIPSYRTHLFFLLSLLFLLTHFWIFIKVVEQSCMIQNVPLGKVTVGDWIVEDVFVKGKRITGPRDLGITEKQLSQLKTFKVKRVKVKYGIPFVPSFLLAFVSALWFGAWYLNIFSVLYG